MTTPQAPSQPTDLVTDPLHDLLRSGARQLIAQAVEAELEAFLAEFVNVRTADGRAAVVRNGYLPERTTQTGVGGVEVKVPRVRDRSGSGIRFHSTLLPPYLKRAKSVEELLPWLYLRGISTGDFSQALEALLGKDAPELSANTISRLKQRWTADHTTWSQRSLKVTARTRTSLTAAAITPLVLVPPGPDGTALAGRRTASSSGAA